MPQTTEMNPSLMVHLLLISAFCYGAQPDGYLQIYPPYNETDPRTPLTFALLHSFGGSFVSSGAVAGVQVALDVINSNPEILPGYSLHYTLTDSQVGKSLHVVLISRESLLREGPVECEQYFPCVTHEELVPHLRDISVGLPGGFLCSFGIDKIRVESACLNIQKGRPMCINANSI